jgi:hypothetical protein
MIMMADFPWPVHRRGEERVEPVSRKNKWEKGTCERHLTDFKRQIAKDDRFAAIWRPAEE